MRARRPIPFCAVRPHAAPVVEAGECIQIVHDVLLIADRHITCRGHGILLRRELEFRVAPRHNHVQRLMPGRFRYIDPRFELLAVEIRNIDFHSYPVLFLHELQIHLLCGGAYILRNLGSHVHAGAERCRNIKFLELVRFKINEIYGQKPHVIDVGDSGRKHEFVVGERPIVPLLLSRPVAFHIADMNRMPRPADGSAVQHAVGFAKINCFNNLFFLFYRHLFRLPMVYSQ